MRACFIIAIELQAFQIVQSAFCITQGDTMIEQSLQANQIPQVTPADQDPQYLPEEYICMRVRTILRSFCGDHDQGDTDYAGFDELVRMDIRRCIKDGFVDLFHRSQHRGPKAVRGLFEDRKIKLAKLLPKSKLPQEELLKAWLSASARAAEIFSMGVYRTLDNFMLQDNSLLADEEKALKALLLWNPSLVATGAPAASAAPAAPAAPEALETGSLRHMSQSVPTPGVTRMSNQPLEGLAPAPAADPSLTPHAIDAGRSE